MTEQDLKSRILDLTAQAKQMEANLFGIQGAIQDCQFWLMQLENKIVEENSEN